MPIMARSIALLFVTLSLIQMIPPAPGSPVGTELNISVLKPLTESRAGILMEMTKKYLELSKTAAKTLFQENESIQNYKKAVEAQVLEAKSSVKSQLKDLNLKVSKAMFKAMITFKNIIPCMIKEKLDRMLKVHTSRISRCKSTFSFNSLKLKLTKLLEIQTKADFIIPKCIALHPFSNSKLRACLEKGLNDGYASILSLKANIELNALKISTKAGACVQDSLGNLDLAIEKISDDFTECVDKRYPTTPTPR